VRARQADGDLLLAAPRGPVQRILALTGLIDVFSVHASVEDAVRIIPPLVHLARAGQQFPAWPWGRYSCHGVDLPRAPCCRVRRFNPAFRPAWLMHRVACSLAGGRAHLPSAAGGSCGLLVAHGRVGIGRAFIPCSEELALRVLMLAAPGAGKGTQGLLVAEHFGVPHIATGDLLRDHVSRETDLGQQVKRFLDRGDLVPDGIVLDMVRGALEAAKKGSGGYVLDGLPRTMEQARAVYRMTVELDLTADVALYLQVGEDELIRRLLARAEQEGRADDAENVIRRRLALYGEVTEPILGWYEGRGILVSVAGDRPVEDVTREVLVALEVLQAVVGQVPDSDRRSIDLTGLDAAFGATQSSGPASRD